MIAKGLSGQLSALGRQNEIARRWISNEIQYHKDLLIGSLHGLKRCCVAQRSITTNDRRLNTTKVVASPMDQRTGKQTDNSKAAKHDALLLCDFIATQQGC